MTKDLTVKRETDHIIRLKEEIENNKKQFTQREESLEENIKEAVKNNENKRKELMDR